MDKDLCEAGSAISKNVVANAAEDIDNKVVALNRNFAPLAGEVGEVNRALAGSIGYDLAKWNRELTLGLSPIAGELAKRNRELTLGLSPIVGALAKWNRELTLRLSPLAGEFGKIHRALAATMRPVTDDWVKQHWPLAATMRPIITGLISPFIDDLHKRGQLLERKGWFPHYTISEDFLVEHQNNPNFDTLLLDYYRRNWPTVRQTIEQQLATYLVDDEAKASFREAFGAHENGLYRSVCRNLLPEVERVVRVELHYNRVGQFSVGKLMDECFGDLPISVLPDLRSGFVGFRHLTGHLYKQIRNEDDRQYFLSHPIPNRHAVIHGLVAYSSEKNSLNSIFMAEYVFQLITKRKSFEKDAALRT